MPRKLQPCGTRAAYARHLYNKEEPCGPCKAANMIRVNSAPSGGKRYEMEASAALEANPPVIVWRRKNNGVWVHVSIDDPHAETKSELRRTRQLEADAARAREREIAAEQVERLRKDVLELMQAEADEVAERFRKHRADNTPLMSAARRSI